MKHLKLFIPVVAGLMLVSFNSSRPVKKLNFTTGAFGVCACETGETSFNIKLTINDDFTFTYYNSTNPKEVIDTKGTWSREGNTIKLQDYESQYAINNKWTIDDNEKCLKSRKGLNFTRLCNVKECK